MSSDTIRSSRRPLEFLENQGFGLPTVPVALALVSITVSELAVFYGLLEYALWGFLSTLLFCVLAPLRFSDDASALQTLALIPVFRLVNLGMPVFFDLTLYWLAFIYAPFLPAVYLIATSRPETAFSFGWIRALVALPLALPLSVALGVVEYTIINPVPLIPAWTNGNLLLVGFVMFGLVATVEELFFRGLLQPVLQHRVGRWSGLAIPSLLFGLMHSGYGVPHELLFAVVLGLLLGLVYEYVESLALVILIHGTIDVVLFAVVPYHRWLVPYVSGFVPL